MMMMIMIVIIMTMMMEMMMISFRWKKIMCVDASEDGSG